MIEELVLGTETKMCLGVGIYYRKSPRSIQKHWDAGRMVQCVHMKMYTINFVFTATVNHIWSSSRSQEQQA